MANDHHSDCPFCKIIRDEPEKLEYESEHLVGFKDAYPVNPGHTLIVPRDHITAFNASPAAWGTELLTAVQTVQQEIIQQYDPDGYNIGMNLRGATGQTIDHLNWHIILRYIGDVSDPEGGIRRVIPDQQKY